MIFKDSSKKLLTNNHFNINKMSNSKHLKELFLSINDYFVNEIDEIINDNPQKYISKHDNNTFLMQPDKKNISKNIENSIKACFNLGMQLDIIGEGDQFEYLKQVVKSLNANVNSFIFFKDLKSFSKDK